MHSLRQTLVEAFSDLVGTGGATSLFGGAPVGLLVDEGIDGEIVYQDADGALTVVDAPDAVTGGGADNLETVATCVKAVCDTVTAIPVYTADQDGKPVRSVLDDFISSGPNPYTRWSTFVELLVRDLLLHGNCYALVQRGGVAPSALWHLPAAWVYPRAGAHESGALATYYQVRDEVFVNVPGAPPAVMHALQRPQGGIPPMGRSTVSALRAIMSHQARADDLSADTAVNGRQGYALATDQEMTQEQLEAAAKGWKKATSGRRTWNRAPILSDGLKPVPISMSAQDMQFLETTKLDRTRIAAAFGVPPIRLNDLSESSYAAAYQQDRSYIRNAVMPVLTELISALHASVLDGLPTLRVEYDVEAVSRAEPLQFAKQLAIEVRSGIRTPAQAAVASGYEWTGTEPTNEEWLQQVGKAPGGETSGGGTVDGDPPLEPAAPAGTEQD